jgi:hypothetical protein
MTDVAREGQMALVTGVGQKESVLFLSLKQSEKSWKSAQDDHCSVFCTFMKYCLEWGLMATLGPRKVFEAGLTNSLFA